MKRPRSLHIDDRQECALQFPGGIRHGRQFTDEDRGGSAEVVTEIVGDQDELLRRGLDLQMLDGGPVPSTSHADVSRWPNDVGHSAAEKRVKVVGDIIPPIVLGVTRIYLCHVIVQPGAKTSSRMSRLVEGMGITACAQKLDTHSDLAER